MMSASQADNLWTINRQSRIPGKSPTVLRKIPDSFEENPRQLRGKSLKVFRIIIRQISTEDIADIEDVAARTWLRGRGCGIPSQSGVQGN